MKIRDKFTGTIHEITPAEWHRLEKSGAARMFEVIERDTIIAESIVNGKPTGTLQEFERTHYENMIKLQGHKIDWIAVDQAIGKDENGKSSSNTPAQRHHRFNTPIDDLNALFHEPFNVNDGFSVIRNKARNIVEQFADTAYQAKFEKRVTFRKSIYDIRSDEDKLKVVKRGIAEAIHHFDVIRKKDFEAEDSTKTENKIAGWAVKNGNGNSAQTTNQSIQTINATHYYNNVNSPVVSQGNNTGKTAKKKSKLKNWIKILGVTATLLAGLYKVASMLLGF